MRHVELITLIAKLNLKRQCQGQFYVIIVMHIYLWVQLENLKYSTKWNENLPKPKIPLVVSNKRKMISLGKVTGWWSLGEKWPNFLIFRGVFGRD